MNEHPYPQPPAGLRWRKSSLSQGDNDCVEVAKDPNGGRWLRETTCAAPPHFVPESSWRAFVVAVKDDEFED